MLWVESGSFCLHLWKGLVFMLPGKSSCALKGASFQDESIPFFVGVCSDLASEV